MCLHARVHFSFSRLFFLPNALYPPLPDDPYLSIYDSSYPPIPDELFHPQIAMYLIPLSLLIGLGFFVFSSMATPLLQRREVGVRCGEGR